MNKKNAVTKINKYGKIGKVISIIIIAIVSVVLIATVASVIVLNIIPDNVMTLSMGTQAELTVNPVAFAPDTNINQLSAIADAFNRENIKGGLNLGAISVKFDSAEVVGNTIVARSEGGVEIVSLHRIADALLFVIASLILTLISFVFANRLCRAFEICDTPFGSDVIVKMRRFAYSLLPWALFSSVPESVLNSVFGEQIEVAFDLDLNILFTVLVILALTTVFKYGAMLQQESDETL